MSSAIQTKRDVINAILAGKPARWEHGKAVDVYAPANIALVKYWGKRNSELNLPVTSSFSVSLGALGSRINMAREEEAGVKQDTIILNGAPLAADSSFTKRASAYLDLFRPEPDFYFRMETQNTIPTAAGFASSASGFAALAKAVNVLFAFNLSNRELSILARLGSGSAARSLWDGFVEWQAGTQDDGMDSHGDPFEAAWPEFRMGALVISAAEKPVGSREGMQRCVDHCRFYEQWPRRVADDIRHIKACIQNHDFPQCGKLAEENALAMHALMIATQPPLLYWLPESVAAMQKVWTLRQDGLPVWFTMDAGPNLKLLFEQKDEAAIHAEFPGLHIVAPFLT